MRNLMELYAPLRDDVGGSGGDGTGGTGGTGDTGGTGGTAWTPPDGFPKDFIGASQEESFSKLLAGHNDLNTRFEGMRTKLATLPKAPESPDKYAFDPGEKLAPYFGDMSKNPAMDYARKAAHKAGMSQEQFSGFISDVYGPMAEQGLLAKPFDPGAELTAFQKAGGLDQKAAAEALTNAETFAKGLTAQLKVPEAIKQDVDATLTSLTDTAAGNWLLSALSSRLAESGIRIAGEGADNGALTKADIDKMTADPRIDPANREHHDPARRFDPAMRERYDNWFRANPKG